MTTDFVTMNLWRPTDRIAAGCGRSGAQLPERAIGR